MNKIKTYQRLEKSFVKYDDLINVPVRENGNCFVMLPRKRSGNFGAIGRYIKNTDMKAQYPLIPVRLRVKEKLDRVNLALKNINDNFQLIVTYGYRSLSVQRQYFNYQKKLYLANKDYSRDENINEVILTGTP